MDIRGQTSLLMQGNRCTKLQEAGPLYPNKNRPIPWIELFCQIFSRKAGVVVNPLPNIGRKISAVAIIANAARASTTPTELVPNTSPFKPTNCSVDRLVNSKDPATTGQLSARPPVKYSSAALSDRHALDNIIGKKGNRRGCKHKT